MKALRKILILAPLLPADGAAAEGSLIGNSTRISSGGPSTEQIVPVLHSTVSDTTINTPSSSQTLANDSELPSTLFQISSGPSLDALDQPPTPLVLDTIVEQPLTVIKPNFNSDPNLSANLHNHFSFHHQSNFTSAEIVSGGRLLTNNNNNDIIIEPPLAKTSLSPPPISDDDDSSYQRQSTNTNKNFAYHHHLITTPSVNHNNNLHSICGEDLGSSSVDLQKLSERNATNLLLSSPVRSLSDEVRFHLDFLPSSTRYINNNLSPDPVSELQSVSVLNCSIPAPPTPPFGNPLHSESDLFNQASSTNTPLISSLTSSFSSPQNLTPFSLNSPTQSSHISSSKNSAGHLPTRFSFESSSSSSSYSSSLSLPTKFPAFHRRFPRIPEILSDKDSNKQLPPSLGSSYHSELLPDDDDLGLFKSQFSLSSLNKDKLISCDKPKSFVILDSASSRVQQQDFLSLSLSPPLNRRREMPALRGPFISLSEPRSANLSLDGSGYQDSPGSDEEQEDVSQYCRGGYHPIVIGEKEQEDWFMNPFFKTIFNNLCNIE